MNNADIYIEKYKLFERAVRERYGLKNGDSISRFLGSNDRFRKLSEDIKYCQEVRNWLQHEPKVSGEFAIYPSREMIDFIDDLTQRIVSPKLCQDIAIKIDHLFSKSMNASLKDTVLEMKRRGFSHVPVLKGGMVVGVLDENSLFNYLCDTGSVTLDSKTKLSDIQSYLSLDGRKTERFLFAKPGLPVEDADDMIEDESRRGKRVVMIFLTASGKSNSQLRGMLTPWDIRE